MSTLGKNLKHLREFHDHTQKYAGELMGVDQSVYSRYEKDLLHPSEEQVAKFAAHYQVPVELLRGAGAITMNMPNANGTQVANGDHVNQQQHVVSEEFVKRMLEQYALSMREHTATVMSDMHQVLQAVANANERSLQLMELWVKQQQPKR